jgi:hypothetical protein
MNAIWTALWLAQPSVAGLKGVIIQRNFPEYPVFKEM